MAKKKKALGRGLSALIPNQPSAATAPSAPANKAADVDAEGSQTAGSTVSEPATVAGLRELALTDIIPNAAQPRQVFDEEALDELAASIRESGLIQPIVVREVSDGFEIIAGERRWRASQRAGLTKVPVVVKEMTDAEAFAVAIVENIQREDLNPLEEANAYQRLIDEFGYTQQTLSASVGKSRSAIANTVRLINLSPKVQQYIVNGDLSPGHARTLIGLSDVQAERVAARIVADGLTVRDAEQLSRSKSTTPKKKKTSIYRDDERVREIVNALQEAVGTKVVVKDRKGKGHIEIHYANYDVLQGVLERMLGES